MNMPASAPAPHGRLNIDGRRYATETIRNPKAGSKRVEAQGVGLTVDEKLQPGDSRG